MVTCQARYPQTEEKTTKKTDDSSAAYEYEKRFIWLKVDKKSLSSKAQNWFKEQFFFSPKNNSVLVDLVETDDSFYARIQLKGQFAGNYTFSINSYDDIRGNFSLWMEVLDYQPTDSANLLDYLSKDNLKLDDETPFCFCGASKKCNSCPKYGESLYIVSCLPNLTTRDYSFYFDRF